VTRRFLVTGSSGNVGGHVLSALRAAGVEAVRAVRGAEQVGPDDPTAVVDFETGEAPVRPFDGIFLMRPPRIADPAPFERFLDRYDRGTRVVFLSVLGADRQPWLPHARIEKVIARMGFPHVFVRPGYFMENLTTTLHDEIARSGRIVMPAGGLELDWISARDVGALCAHALTEPSGETAIDAVSGQRMGFSEVCKRVNAALGTKLAYEPLSMPGYIRHARRHGADWSFVGVMLLLHWLPRLSAEAPAGPDAVTPRLGRPPETIEQFAHREAAVLLGRDG
jgi:uncharacterized protein YbjT (DUF2867 family)